jgi:hypothetical protein
LLGENRDSFDSEVVAAIAPYLDYIEDRKATHSLLVEWKLYMHPYLEGVYGTADALLFNKDEVEIVDLKFGKGVIVSAEDNPQLKLYALGGMRIHALEFTTPPSKVVTTIIQPRVNGFSSVTYTPTELKLWAFDEVADKASLAEQGLGERISGEHCRFCKVKATCRALHDFSISALKEDFAEPAQLSVKELGEVFAKAPIIESWLSAVCEYVNYLAVQKGVHFDGYKLVEGRSTRKWVLEEEELIAALRNYHLSDEQMFSKKIAGIPAIEKLIGKEEITKLVYKEAGKLSLAPESSTRKAAPAKTAKNEFND